jgi:hypothetical protein
MQPAGDGPQAVTVRIVLEDRVVKVWIFCEDRVLNDVCNAV